jgi:hypothetical protein
MTGVSFDRLNAALGGSLRVLLTVLVLAGILGFATCLYAGWRGRPRLQGQAAAISWRELTIMAGPFSVAYLMLLAAQQLNGDTFDRYQLPLLVLLLVLLGRYYQERVSAHLPIATILLIAVFGAFSLAATHDEFALYRGYVSAIHEIRSAGAPATAILGPWEFEGWTEVEQAGYVNDPRIRVPAGAYTPPAAGSQAGDCDTSTWYFRDRAPAIKPVFGVSSDQDACGGRPAFPAVIYRTWIAPHINSIYAVRLPAPSSH